MYNNNGDHGSQLTVHVCMCCSISDGKLYKITNHHSPQFESNRWLFTQLNPLIFLLFFFLSNECLVWKTLSWHHQVILLPPVFRLLNLLLTAYQLSQRVINTFLYKSFHSPPSTIFLRAFCFVSHSLCEECRHESSMYIHNACYTTTATTTTCLLIINEKRSLLNFLNKQKMWGKHLFGKWNKITQCE